MHSQIAAVAGMPDLSALYLDQLECFDAEGVAKALDRAQRGIVPWTTADRLYGVVTESGFRGQVTVGQPLAGSPLMKSKAFS